MGKLRRSIICECWLSDLIVLLTIFGFGEESMLKGPGWKVILWLLEEMKLAICLQVEEMFS